MAKQIVTQRDRAAMQRALARIQKVKAEYREWVTYVTDGLMTEGLTGLKDRVEALVRSKNNEIADLQVKLREKRKRR
jgi:hypothetical protein